MNSRLHKSLLLLLCATTLSACSGKIPLINAEVVEDKPRAATLADLQPAVFEPPATEVQTVSIDEVIRNYELLLEMSPDPETRLLAMQRLADLRVEKGELGLDATGNAELTAAILSLEQLLEEYPEHRSNDRVLYQLAKTRDLQGNQEENLETLDRIIAEHPDSRYRAEVQFRRGEILFSRGEYVAAQQAFEDVLATGEPQFQVTGHYMRGWSLFKQNRYEVALMAFTNVLDILLPEGALVTSIDQQNQTLVEDLLRVMGLGFSYEGGANAIPGLFARTGSKPYEFLVYDRYGQLLLEKEQYSDAIEVYRTFIQIYPLSLYAPQYQQRIIDVTLQAGFASSVLEEKERFVTQYGKDTAFWNSNNPIDLEFTREKLAEYIPELAAVHYNLGKQARETQPATRATLDTSWEEYGKAAEYYRAFAETFPEMPDTPRMLFLLGESEAARENWQAAIDAWERSGFDYPKYPDAAESAYAAILGYPSAIEQVEKQPAGEQRDGLLQALEKQQQETRLRFVRVHSTDPRASDVLYTAAAEVFREELYHETIPLAEQLLAWQPAIPLDRQRDARLLKAHSLFALENYGQAELAYEEALVTLTPEDPRRKAVSNNLAASIFRQAETARDQGNVALAIAGFQRVVEKAPRSDVRVNAEYDLASLYLETEQWSEAIPVLEGFRNRYPDHSLSGGIAGKLALAYQATEQWGLAATEVSRMGGPDETPEQKRERLLITAELYERGGRTPEAINAYRSYANTYPEPLEDYFDAAAKLVVLYGETGQSDKRRFWLKKQVETYQKHSDQASDRLRYMTASAATELAEEAFSDFTDIKLRLPLQKSMPRKTKALRDTMKAYQDISALGVAEFSTQAGYRMAELYAILSRDLMDSDRPAGLSELELEQYDLLLEEQAFPFEESAISIHEQNVQKSWEGLYDEWVRNSFEALGRLFPARYRKEEKLGGAYDSL